MGRTYDMLKSANAGMRLPRRRRIDPEQPRPSDRNSILQLTAVLIGFCLSGVQLCWKTAGPQLLSEQQLERVNGCVFAFLNIIEGVCVVFVFRRTMSSLCGLREKISN